MYHKLKKEEASQDSDYYLIAIPIVKLALKTKFTNLQKEKLIKINETEVL